jgi:hypothetical protein
MVGGSPLIVKLQKVLGKGVVLAETKNMIQNSLKANGKDIRFL